MAWRRKVLASCLLDAGTGIAGEGGNDRNRGRDVTEDLPPERARMFAAGLLPWLALTGETRIIDERNAADDILPLPRLVDEDRLAVARDDILTECHINPARPEGRPMYSS